MFRFIFAITLAAVFTASAQTNHMIRPEAIDALRATQLTIQEGKTVAGGVAVTAQSQGAKVWVWSDKKFYLPGEEVRLRAFGMADDATNLQVYIQEWYYPTGAGNPLNSDFYPCECGDSNGGTIATLQNYNSVTLLTKKVPSGRGGRYDFVVQISKFPGNNMPSVPYQTTRLSVFLISNRGVDQNPIVIDSLTQGYVRGQVLFLTGTFPVGVAMHYYVGTAPYNGAFSNQPSVISTDGRTLVVPGFEGIQMEGRVILMLPDGSYSTISPQTFVSMPSSTQRF